MTTLPEPLLTNEVVEQLRVRLVSLRLTKEEMDHARVMATMDFNLLRDIVTTRMVDVCAETPLVLQVIDEFLKTRQLYLTMVDERTDEMHRSMDPDGWQKEIDEELAALDERKRKESGG